MMLSLIHRIIRKPTTNAMTLMSQYRFLENTRPLGSFLPTQAAKNEVLQRIAASGTSMASMAHIARKLKISRSTNTELAGSMGLVAGSVRSPQLYSNVWVMNTTASAVVATEKKFLLCVSRL